MVENAQEQADVDVMIYENDCGAIGYDLADINKDCAVDLNDFAILAAEWLTSRLPNE